MRRRFFLWLPLALLTLGALAVAADWWFCLPVGYPNKYVGRDECARCHAKQVDAWTGSDHQRAMAVATPATVLGNFDNQDFDYYGIKSRLFRRGDGFFATTDGPSGALETYKVQYTFGVYPLQQYLIEFPKGRYQCLPITWDSQNKRWYHLYPDEKITADDPLHWTRPLQNWNYMCADCHSTNLERDYDVKTDRYHTTWSEINVSCETCHGAGGLHVAVADRRRLFWDRRYGFGLPNLKSPDSRVEIETCAPCHARRRAIYPGCRAGAKFLDYYVPEMLDSGIYHADGQILDEDYEYGSFLQSKMYGQHVRCTDCHDPHTMRVKFTDPATERPIIKDNRLCGQCHVPGKYDTPQHHHHPDAAKPGALCVECHMPETKYMVVDPRRDHSIRIPRPELTVWLKIPNACNGCHHDQTKGETPEWALAQTQMWYAKKNEPRHFAYAIDAGRNGRPEGEKLLEAVTRRNDLSAIVRASALLLLSRYGTETGLAAANRGLEDPDELVRYAAVQSLQAAPVAELQRRLTPLLRDSVRAVRIEAARLLTVVPSESFGAKDREAFDKAIAEYFTGLEGVAEQPGAHVAMGVAYGNLGQFDKAEKAYRAALRLDGQFVPARINLAMLANQQGKKDMAADGFGGVIALATKQLAEAQERSREVTDLRRKLDDAQPQSPEAAAIERRLNAAVARSREIADLKHLLAEANYSLGLLLAEDDAKLNRAAEHLGETVRFDPENARAHYNLGLAMQRLERTEEAEQSLTAAYKMAPRESDYLYALAIFYYQQKRWPRAVACAEELVRRRPEDARVRGLLDEIQRAAAANRPEEKAK